MTTTARHPGECAGCRGPIKVGDQIAPAPYRRWIHATDECEAHAKARFMPKKKNPAYAHACPTCHAEPDAYCTTETGETRTLHPERG